MREMTARLADERLAAAYRARPPRLPGAPRRRGQQVRRRAAAAGDASAGGMPDRVKCLHALVAHELAAGPGANPFGREALAAAGRLVVAAVRAYRRAGEEE